MFNKFDLLKDVQMINGFYILDSNDIFGNPHHKVHALFFLFNGLADYWVEL